MPELAIPFDPTNPGHFYACCGLNVLVDAASGGEASVVSRFEVRHRVPRQGRFLIASLSDSATLADPAALLRSVSYEVDSSHAEAGLAPVVATLPLGVKLRLNWWTNEFETQKTPFKGWAGQVTPDKLFSELPALLPQGLLPEDLFQFAVNTKTKFGVDPRSAWEALNIGFSPNEHSGADVYPAVELLAAIGLQVVRPLSSPDGRRFFRYCLWRDPLPLLLAASCPWPGLDVETFQFEVATRGSYAFFSPSRPLQTM